MTEPSRCCAMPRSTLCRMSGQMWASVRPSTGDWNNGWQSTRSSVPRNTVLANAAQCRISVQGRSVRLARQSTRGSAELDEAD
eukprot:4683908-Lingulodinium_polyedra.AAC.2